MYLLKEFFSFTIFDQVSIIYLILINIITFFYFGLDKLKAQLGNRRISERALWILSIVGGSLGALLGMNFFRHKTKKVSFQAGFAIILAIQIFVIFTFFLD